MSDSSKASICSIPNIGYYGNSYIPNNDNRIAKVIEQDEIWKKNNVILEPFNEHCKYRNAKFPEGWEYMPNPSDPFKRSGWYVNKNKTKIVEVFMKDASYQTGIIVTFIN